MSSPLTHASQLPLPPSHQQQQQLSSSPSQRPRRRSAALNAIVFLLLLAAVSALGTLFFSLRVQQSAQLYINPIIPTNAPDPGVAKFGGTYFAVTSSGTVTIAQSAFPIFCSPNLVSWDVCGYVFPGYAHPQWTFGVDLSAPELHAVEGHFVAYFSARHIDGPMVIGAGVANDVEGPYTDVGEPIVGDSQWGAFDAQDPTRVVDPESGNHYLLWARVARDPLAGPDSQRSGQQRRQMLQSPAVPGDEIPPQSIVIQQLNRGGLSVVGNTTVLLTPTLEWEGNILRAPWALRRSGWWYLFYTAGSGSDGSMCIGVARSRSLFGQYVKLEEGPILSTPANGSNAWAGPGHCSVVSMSATSSPTARFTPPGSTGRRLREVSPDSLGTDGPSTTDVSPPPARYMIVYAAWERGRIGDRFPRMMLADPVDWHADWPRVNDGRPSDNFQRMGF